MKSKIWFFVIPIFVIGLFAVWAGVVRANAASESMQGDPARVHVAHFAPFASEIISTSVTVRVNGTDALTDFVFGDTTGYLDFAEGSYLIEILPTGTNTVAISGTVSLTAGMDYTLAAIGNASLQPLELLALVDDTSAPASGNAKIRVAHLAPFAADLLDTEVDICTDSGIPVLTHVPYKAYTDPYVELPAGDYDLQIAAPGGTCSTIYLDIPEVRLMDGDIVDVFAIGDITNQPLQVTSLTGLSFTPAKVNVAHFAPFASDALLVPASTLVPTSTSVTVRVNGIDALTGFMFGEWTGYVELGPGPVLVEILPTGSDTVVISGTFELTPAASYTLAAIGDGSNQPLELFALADDPTLPAAGNSRVRIVHLAPFAATLEATEVDICTQDGAAILTNVPYKGYTDPYLELPAGLYDLKIATADSSCETTLIDIPLIALREGQVATVFAIGDGINYPPTVVSDVNLAPIEIFLPVIQN